MSIIFRIRNSPTLKSFCIGVVALSLCVAFMMLTDPGEVSLAALLVPFGLLGVALFALSNSVMLSMFSNVISPKTRRFVASATSFSVVMMLLLQSLNQLTLRDMLILGVLMLTMAVYVTRVEFGANK